MSDSTTGPRSTTGDGPPPSSLPLPQPSRQESLDQMIHDRVDSRPSRDETFMEIARVLRLRSTCKRGKVGVVLVRDARIVASGYNGAPPGAPHCFELGCLVDENLHVLGCQRAIHAEVNAIAFAARAGSSTEGCTIYSTAGPCLKCAQQVISAGIVRFVYGVPYRLPEGLSLLIENGIEAVRLDPFVPQARAKFDG